MAALSVALGAAGPLLAQDATGEPAEAAPDELAPDELGEPGSPAVPDAPVGPGSVDPGTVAPETVAPETVPLTLGATPTAPPACQTTDARVVSSVAVERGERCHDQAGEPLRFAPGGLLQLRSGDGTQQRSCLTASTEAQELFLGSFASPLTGADVVCEGGADGVRCTRGERVLARCGAAAPVEGDGSTKVFIFHIDEGDLPVSAADVVTDLLAARMAEHEGFDVLSGQNMAELIQHEATRELVGCSEESCFGEIGRQLGARYFTSGSLVYLADEEELRLKVSLFDVAQARVVATEEAAGNNLEDLSARIGVVVHNLLSPLTGEAVQPMPPVDKGRKVLGPSGLGGAAAVGGATAAVGAVMGTGGSAAVTVVGWTLYLAQISTFLLFEVAIPLMYFSGMLGTPCIFPLVLLASAGVDVMSGYPVRWVRATVVATLATLAYLVTVGGCFGITTCGAFLVTIPVIPAVGLVQTAEVLLKGLTFAIPVASLVGGAAAGVLTGGVYSLGLAVFPDEAPLGGSMVALTPLGPPARPRAQLAQAY